MPSTIQFQDRTVGEILTDIRANSPTPRDQGTNFEKLFLKAAPLIPDLEIKNIWNWADWTEQTSATPDRGLNAQDDGVDLVAEIPNGTLVAIQCKCYAEDHKVGKRDIEKFVTAANSQIFGLRWFVATSECNPVAEKLMHRNEIKIIDFRQYLDLKFDKKPRLQRKPWELQQEAIDAVIQGFKESGRDRGRIIMACGTGKTFTAMRIAEQLAPGKANILFIAPSIALVAQTRREWLSHTGRNLACTVICSDKTAGRNAEDISATEISCATTTDPQTIAAELNMNIPANTARAVFCTYQSLEKLRVAQHEHGAPDFDLAIIDEAHRTTGYLDEDRAGLFQLIHDPNKIQAAKRLYMTATPRIYQDKKGKVQNDDAQAQIVDMNDVEAYGNEFYRLTFKRAVDAKMLCDYRVIALGITENCMDDHLKNTLLALNDDIGGVGKAADTQALLALGAIALAINGIVEGKNTPGVLARTIAFASNIRRSKWLASALQKAELNDWVADANQPLPNAIHSKHLDGTSSALQRNAALRELNSIATEQNPRLITNAKLFTEGVDVPALNAVAFLDPRQSKVDTIQAVGRVMRKDESSGKTFGYIIVPVILPPEADLLDTLNADLSRFKTLGAVLRALQSHDERLYTDLTERLTFATMNTDYKPDPERPPSEDYEPLKLALLDENAKQVIYAQLAKKTGIAQQGKIIADAISQSIERAARLFKQEGATDIIARTIGTPSDNEEESCKIAALLIANACIMHKRLEETGNLGGLTKIEAANIVRDPASALVSAWHTILAKDYAPVFQDATALLANLPPHKNIQAAVGTLIQCAIDNATTLNDLGFDHAGPLYHSILGSAQSDGAYYTKNLSAYLLAGLAFDDQFTDWKDPNQVNNLKVVDPACGTGTLLMAALNIIKKRAAEAQNLNEAEINKLHKRLVENSIYGFDINKYSVQLAACNLTIGAPNTDYERMNLHTLQHGAIKDADNAVLDAVGWDDVRHGVLEKLLDESMGKMVLEPPPLFGKGILRKEITKVLMPEKFDAVIYNPPFTETLHQGKKFSNETKQAMRDRLQFIKSTLDQRDPRAAVALGKRSIRPFFTPLTNSLLSAQKGKLAKVIPATACTSENGKTERQYLANNFNIEMVVTSHDPKHVNFSENTSIHECLVMGSRNTDKNQPTRFIQLAAYPKDVKEAETLIDAIQNNAGGGRLYTETLWTADKMRAGNWSPVQWFNPHLARTADEINALPKLIVVGDAYSMTDNPTAVMINFDYERSDDGNAFCTIAEDVMQTIQAKPESRATPKSGKEQKTETLWNEKSSCFFITMRFSTTSSRLLAIYSERPAISSAYFAMVAKTPEQEKAFAVFLNSSFGIIQMLNRRTKKLTYPNYEVGHLKTLMLPDPNKADLAPLLAAFEKIKDTPLERLAKCAQDPARKILDHAAAESIGIDPALTDQWREWLSQEPTITNKPYQPS